MTRKFLTLAAGALMLGVSSCPLQPRTRAFAVSWKTFQEERWKIDEAAIKAVVEAAGNTYVSDRRAGLSRSQADSLTSKV